MVKGVSRRVVVVRPDECGLFEQANISGAGLQCAAQRRGARGVPDRQQLSDGTYSAQPQQIGSVEAGAGFCRRGVGFERSMDSGQHGSVKMLNTGEKAE